MGYFRIFWVNPPHFFRIPSLLKPWVTPGSWVFSIVWCFIVIQFSHHFTITLHTELVHTCMQCRRAKWAKGIPRGPNCCFWLRYADTGEGKFWKIKRFFFIYCTLWGNWGLRPPPIFETVAGFLDIHTSTGHGWVTIAMTGTHWFGPPVSKDWNLDLGICSWIVTCELSERANALLLAQCLSELYGVRWLPNTLI